MAAHGIDLLLAGVDTWTFLGQMAVGNFYPEIMGMLAAGIYALCGVLIMLGLWVKQAAGAIALVLAFAAVAHLRLGEGFFSSEAGNGAWYATFMAITFLSLSMVGPGKYGLWAACCTPGNASKKKQWGCCGGGCHDTPMKDSMDNDVVSPDAGK